MTTRRLANKVAMVTGGSRGIGAAIVAAFAAEGADVIICHVAAESEAAAAMPEREGTRDLALRCDVSDGDALGEFHAEARREFGQIDILVNNAGISGETPFERI